MKIGHAAGTQHRVRQEFVRLSIGSLGTLRGATALKQTVAGSILAGSLVLGPMALAAHAQATPVRMATMVPLGTSTCLTGSPQKIVENWTRRSIKGHQVPAFLRCGDPSWGYRHIAVRKHFGGELNADALDVIQLTLQSTNRSFERSPGGEGRNVYHQSVSCYIISSTGSVRIKQTIKVTVVLNATTNNIVTAYIDDPVQDSQPLHCQ